MASKHSDFIAGVGSFLLGIPACIGFIGLAMRHHIVLLPWFVLLVYIYSYDYKVILHEKSWSYTITNFAINVNGASCVMYIIFLIVKVIKLIFS